MLLLLAVVLVGGVAAVALGAVRGGLEPPTTSLPAVSLPAGPLRPGDVDDVRFSLGLRGYRMEQVDAVLDRLRAELAARDAELAERERELAALRAPQPTPEPVPEPVPQLEPATSGPPTTGGATVVAPEVP